MSMDWLKVRCSLSTDPRVLAVADAVDEKVCTVVGALLMLWSAASIHSDEGTLPRATPGSIDRMVDLPGFAAALVSVGWLEFADGSPGGAPGGAVIPRWGEHNSDTARRRAENAARMARERAEKSNEKKRTRSVHKETHTPSTETARAAHQEQEQEEEDTHTQRAGENSGGEGQQGAGSRQQGDPIPFPAASSAPSVVDPLVWRDHGEAGLTAGFENAGLESAARARIAARFPIAADDAEWVRLLAEATAHVLRTPGALAKVRHDAEWWFTNKWVAMERVPGGQQAAGSPGGGQQVKRGKRSRDGPSAGGSGGAEARTKALLDKRERERTERTEKRS